MRNKNRYILLQRNRSNYALNNHTNKICYTNIINIQDCVFELSFNHAEVYLNLSSV